MSCVSERQCHCHKVRFPYEEAIETTACPAFDRGSDSLPGLAHIWGTKKRPFSRFGPLSGHKENATFSRRSFNVSSHKKLVLVRPGGARFSVLLAGPVEALRLWRSNEPGDVHVVPHQALATRKTRGA